MWLPLRLNQAYGTPHRAPFHPAAVLKRKSLVFPATGIASGGEARKTVVGTAERFGWGDPAYCREELRGVTSHSSGDWGSGCRRAS